MFGKYRVLLMPLTLA